MAPPGSAVAPADGRPPPKRGAFISPNDQVDLEDRPEEDSERAARELVSAAELRFDLSDQLDPEFGGHPEAGVWNILQGFLADPGDIDGTAQRLEEAARAARLRPWRPRRAVPRRGSGKKSWSPRPGPAFRVDVELDDHAPDVAHVGPLEHSRRSIPEGVVQ